MTDDILFSISLYLVPTFSSSFLKFLHFFSPNSYIFSKKFSKISQEKSRENVPHSLHFLERHTFLLLPCSRNFFYFSPTLCYLGCNFLTIIKMFPHEYHNLTINRPYILQRCMIWIIIPLNYLWYTQNIILLRINVWLIAQVNWICLYSNLWQ